MYFRADGDTHGGFVCECSDASCVDPIQVTPAEYADIRGPTRFFVTGGHEREELERVVEKNDRFFVVEKPVVS